MNRDASRHPPRITEKRQAGPATGGPSERVPARIRRADGDGPRRAKGLTPPLCKPRPAHAAEPHPDAAPRQTGRRRNGRSPTRRRSRAAGMSAPGMQGPKKGPSSHPVRVHAADTARFPRTEPAPRGGPDHFFLFGRSASPLDHTGVAEPVNAPRNGLRPARSLNDGTRFGR